MGTFKPGTLAAALAAVAFGISASADDKQDKFRTQLSGYNEVHFVTNVTPPALRGAISTAASGSFRAEIDDRAQVIDYELSYEGLEGNVTQATSTSARSTRWAESWSGCARPREPRLPRQWQSPRRHARPRAV
jgi:hypothetical protein